MKKIGLYLILGIILFAVTIVACKKSNSSPDYRDQWLGGYNYDVRICRWYPDTAYAPEYEHGNLFVEIVADSSLNIRIDNSTRHWQCKVSENGDLTFVSGDPNYWRYFDGLFVTSDSLDMYCTNYSPGAGVSFEYSCKK